VDFLFFTEFVIRFPVALLCSMHLYAASVFSQSDFKIS